MALDGFEGGQALGIAQGEFHQHHVKAKARQRIQSRNEILRDLHIEPGPVGGFEHFADVAGILGVVHDQ